MSFKSFPEALRGLPLAVFLDVDGTLLEIAETPQAVKVQSELLKTLCWLSLRTDGALALVSGRPIANLDALFAPLRLPCAGLYGFERRNAQGGYYRCPIPDGTVVQTARDALQRLAASHEGLLVEDKRFAVALHYRRAPHLARVVIESMRQLAVAVHPELVLQFGRMVVELRPATGDKGWAVAQFLTQEPFRGRLPVYLGSDVADETAFQRINILGGVSIAVNVRRLTAARANLPDVAAVHDWLRKLPASFESLEGVRSPQIGRPATPDAVGTGRP
jgi:trehalose 6-phosphate phosphatase